MDKKNTKRPVRAVILLGFLLAIIGVAVMGFRAYQSVNQLADDLQEAAEEDPYLKSLKGILADLTTAESNVRAYTITHDAEKDLPDCFRAIQQIDLYIERIEDEELYTQRSSFEAVLNLVSKKIDILEQLIATVDTGDVETAFEKFRSEIERLAGESNVRNNASVPDVSETTSNPPSTTSPSDPLPDPGLENPPTEEEEPEEKPGFFKRLKLFEGKKGKNRDRKTTPEGNPTVPTTLPEKVIALDSASIFSAPPPLPETEIPPRSNQTQLVEDLQVSIAALERADIVAIELQRYHVARLTREGQSAMTNLKALVRQQEIENLAGAQALAINAETRATQTYRFLTLFGAAVLLLYLILIAVIFSDFARNARLTRNLEAQKARAEKLARVKEEFLANMSHEIRTPMNAVIGFAEQLAATPLSEQQSRFLQPIRNSAQYLLALINDILDYSKMESGRFELDQVAFRPLDLAQEVLQTLQPMAEKKGILLRQTEGTPLPAVLKGDPLRLRQMLFNLLGNAIKFTETGAVTLDMQVLPAANCEPEGSTNKEQESAIGGSIEGVKNEEWRKGLDLQTRNPGGSPENLLLRFSVIDTGIGISRDQLEKVFQNFVQADSSTTRRFGGTGLGLSITRKLAELHGGTIDIESEIGRGTQVHLTLPYLPGTAAELSGEERLGQLGAEPLRGKHFLVADDEPYNQELMAVILDKWQVQADIVSNGREAIDLLQERSYDLLLLDLQMPEMDGVAVAEYVRQEMKLDLPILALTATFTQEEIQEAMKSGMNAHLLKPFRESDLLATLLHLLALPFSPAPLVPLPAETPLPALDEKTLFSLQHLQQLTNHNPKAIRRMLDMFVSSTETQLAEIQQALEVRDWDTISMKAHRLAPPTRHLSRDDLVAKLHQLEALATEKQNWQALQVLSQEVGGELSALLQNVKETLEEMPQA